MDPGLHVQTARERGSPARRKARGCSCLFYKADINDELPDWRSPASATASRCARQSQVLDLGPTWHISSSGEVARVRRELDGRYGTDASAFYKAGSPGWNAYTAKTLARREVDEGGTRCREIARRCVLCGMRMQS